MTIYVSDLGISSSNPYSSSNTKVSYVSMNERLNQAPVDRVKGVGSATDAPSRRGVAEKARQDYVAENNPAYTIDFSSAGKALVKNMKLMKSNAEALSAKNDTLTANNRYSLSANNKDNSSRKNDTDTKDVYSFNAVDAAAPNMSVRETEEEDRVGIAEDTEQVTEASASSSKAVLSQYSEFQLSSMVSEGTITQAEMNRELASRADADDAAEQTQSQIMRQAVNAYSYQMNFASTMF
ncbi:MAG: hypothetical protein MJ131_00640 [Lachnospiraceae bacterium]|nr:hypothetical protein [Lachnospiraceae bacterium]